MQEGFRWHICDERGRVLFGRRHNDQMIFARYPDMTDEEKNLVISVFAFSQEIPEDEKMMENKEIKEMVNYLNFKEEQDDKDDFCG
jgi:hypothetical protein